MGFLKYALIVAIAAGVYKYYQRQQSLKLPEHFGGHVDSKFQRVFDAFKQNFADGWEHEGAAFAVYQNGKLVVDIWGGYADEYAMRPWTKDTLTNVFSSTKAIGSLCIAKMSDMGLLKYDDLVTKYWPKFGKHGKDNVTIAMLMSHQAGLAAIDKDLTYEDIADADRLSAIFEDQKPNWPPGTAIGYHAITHGWLAAQLVRRIDPKKRTLGQFFQQEILSKTGNEECFIGLPLEQEHRMARMSPAGVMELLSYMFSSYKQFIMTLRIFFFPVPLFKTIFGNPAFMLGHDRNGFNSPDIHRLEIPAANGACTARGLAQSFNGVIMGNVLSKTTIDYISKPLFVDEPELGFGGRLNMGVGFMFSRSKKNDTWLMGHPGYGGQYVKFDLKHKLAYAYITNGLKAGLGDVCRSSTRLFDTLYDSLD